MGWVFFVIHKENNRKLIQYNMKLLIMVRLYEIYKINYVKNFGWVMLYLNSTKKQI
jgi:hypothetical protein